MSQVPQQRAENHLVNNIQGRQHHKEWPAMAVEVVASARGNAEHRHGLSSPPVLI